MMHSFQTFN